jgi:hypothetical protein
VVPGDSQERALADLHGASGLCSQQTAVTCSMPCGGDPFSVSISTGLYKVGRGAGSGRAARALHRARLVAGSCALFASWFPFSLFRAHLAKENMVLPDAQEDSEKGK